MVEDIQQTFNEYIALEHRREAAGGVLDPAEESRWAERKRQLNLYFEPDLEPRHEDRRGSLRIPTSASLRYASYSDLGYSRMTLVSRTGLFIQTNDPLPIGTRISLWIETGSSELHVFGEVASHHTRANAGSQDLGMGVRFGIMSDIQREEIGELYQSAGTRAIGLGR